MRVLEHNKFSKLSKTLLFSVTNFSTTGPDLISNTESIIDILRYKYKTSTKRTERLLKKMNKIETNKCSLAFCIMFILLV